MDQQHYLHLRDKKSDYIRKEMLVSYVINKISKYLNNLYSMDKAWQVRSDAILLRFRAPLCCPDDSKNSEQLLGSKHCDVYFIVCNVLKMCRCLNLFCHYNPYQNGFLIVISVGKFVLPTVT